MTFLFLNIPRGGGSTGLGNIPKIYQFSFWCFPNKATSEDAKNLRTGSLQLKAIVNNKHKLQLKEMYCLHLNQPRVPFSMITFLSSSSREFDFNEDFPASVDYNENFNRDRLDVGIKETEVLINGEDEEDQVYYSDYAPEAAALMEVEEMEPEEKKGPTLGQVLGINFLNPRSSKGREMCTYQISEPNFTLGHKY